MSIHERDRDILRRLALDYAECTADPIYAERRRLWTDHMSLKPTRPLILATYGMHNVWCREVFGDDTLACEDPFYRGYERNLRMALFQHELGDDNILEPWLTVGAARAGDHARPWGLLEGRVNSEMEGGAWKFDPPLTDWSQLDEIKACHHHVDEQETARMAERLHYAVGDIMPIDVVRAPFYSGFTGDISTCITRLRGLEQLMLDMYEYPDELHRLLGIMRDGILQNQQEAEDAGHYTLTCGQNQAMSCCEELPTPQPNSAPCTRKELWGFFAAQEYALISPEFHDKFLFQYQLPIMAQFGLVHYGCCEDLTRKIDMLRQLKNLRSIAVTPRADVARSAEQIGTDYVMSWRPNPADMVCCGWDEARVRRVISDGLKASKGCRVHIHLKDVETIEGDMERLQRWTEVVRGEIERNW
jgi:hypothetical protein